MSLTQILSRFSVIKILLYPVYKVFLYFSDPSVKEISDKKERL